MRGVSPARRRRVGARRQFLKAFVTRPQDTGAILPSSDELARAMVAELPIETANTIVELGPGTGVFTRLIEERCRPGALVLAFEINADLAQPLTAEFPNFRIVNDSAENIALHLARHGRSAVECVVSSLPWAGFPTEMQERILAAVTAVMPPGARFATFAYIPAAWLPPGRSLRRLLERHFSNVELSPIVWQNTPPAFVYRCTK